MDRAKRKRPFAAADRERFIESCRAAGLRVTEQRLAIYRYLLEDPGHPSAEAIYRALARRYRSLSLATVYNTLEALEDVGLVGQLGIGADRRRFDAVTDRHHHLVCEVCGRVEDVFSPALDRLAPPSSARAFEVRNLSVHFFGRCAGCKGRGRARRTRSRT